MPLRLVLLMALAALATVPRRAGCKPARAVDSTAGPVAAAAASTALGRGSQAASWAPAGRYLLQARAATAGAGGMAGSAAGGASSAAAAGAAPASEAAANSAAPVPERRSAAPAPEAAGGSQVQACFTIHMTFGAACQVGIDRVSATVFPRGSTQEIVAEEEEAAVAALKQGGLPSRG